MEGRELFYSRSKQDVAAINPDWGDSSGGAAAGADGLLKMPGGSWIEKEHARSVKQRTND